MAKYDGAVFIGHGTSEVDGSYDPGAMNGTKQEHIIAEEIVNIEVGLLKDLLLIHKDEQNYKDNDLYGNTYTLNYAQEIHLNAGGGTRVEIYSPCGEKDITAELYVVSELSKLGLNNGGVRCRDYASGNTYPKVNGQSLPYTDYYGVINRAWKQGVSLSIFELGFIDSSDLKIIENNKDKIARILANGMLMVAKKPLLPLVNKPQTSKPQQPIIKEEYKMDYMVCYGNQVDERVAKMLAEYLKCPTMDANLDFKYDGVAKCLISVGGEPQVFGKFSGYTTHKIKGDNRYTTAQLVMDICTGKKKIGEFKIK